MLGAAERYCRVRGINRCIFAPLGGGVGGLRVARWLSRVGVYHDSGVNAALMQLHIVCKFHFI